MIYETIVIAGLILILFAVAGNKKIEIKDLKIGDLTNAQRSILGVLGIIVLILGMGIWQIPPDGDRNNGEDEQTFRIEITNPNEGALVSSPLTVNGTFEGELPEDRYLWMFVYDSEDWYPVHRIEPFNGKWDSKVWLGVGKRDIVVVLVDKDADSEFQKSSNEDDGLENLPQGAQVCDWINVEV